MGSQACVPCHAAKYRSFMQTPMAQSSGRAGTSGSFERFDRTEFRDSRNAFVYSVSRDQQGYYFEFRRQGAKQPIQGRRRLEYFVGSGAVARSYLMSIDGFLYEAPVTYYSASESWNSAPGYADYDYPYLTRPIQSGCLRCHASSIQPIPGTQNAYASPPFREGGVACERCHGPGGDHIRTGKQMINPAKLGATERDSICEQCHLAGEVRVPKSGRDEDTFRAGDPLADYITVFVRSGSESQMKVTSHAENLAQSTCKKASGDRLWCGTCHNPHEVPGVREKAGFFRAKCLSCHNTSSCGAPQALRQASGDNCISCHMPRNPPTDVDHVVFTDHSIRRRPTTIAASPSINADLVPFRAGQVSERDLGLAYATLALREQNAAYRERAFRLLQNTAAQGTQDTQVLAYLAEFYRDRKDDAHALPLYERVWRTDQTQFAVPAALGAYQMQRGNFEEAVRFWDRALAMNPALILVRLNMAAALIRTRHPDQAEAVLRKALDFNPSFQAARDLLSRITK